MPATENTATLPSPKEIEEEDENFVDAYSFFPPAFVPRSLRSEFCKLEHFDPWTGTVVPPPQYLPGPPTIDDFPAFFPNETRPRFQL